MYSRINIYKFKNIPSQVYRLLIVLFVILSFCPPQFAYAEELPLKIMGFVQRDLNGDGYLDMGEITCSCVTDQDRVLVFDSSHDMKISQNWELGTDTANDTWIFDIGNKGGATLIIVFRSENDKQVAELYDDINGDGHVAYQIDNDKVQIKESDHWTLQISSALGWQTTDQGSILSLSALFDKPLVTGLSSEALAKRYMSHDGRTDADYNLVDSNQDGVPEYFLFRLLAPVPSTSAVGRATIWSNVGQLKPVRSPSAVFWPFLDMRPSSGKSQVRLFQQYPIVRIQWDSAEIKGFGLPGYPLEQGFYVQSLQPLAYDTINDVDLEMPHAYYDLANNRDGIPELNIRVFTDYLTTASSSRYQEIRYSWNLFHPGSLLWDYKIGLMDNHALDEIVRFSNFNLRMITYEDLPYWVTKQSWKLSTFVANEWNREESSEGIYDWTPWEGVNPVDSSNPGSEVHAAALDYLDGRSNTSIQAYFNNVREGLRAEYNLRRPSMPVLYFSPVDHRLHLKGAEYGLANLGNARYVIYENRNSDDYVDQWRLIESGVTKKQLFFSPSHLLYTDENSVVVGVTEKPPFEFEVLPPRNHSEWLQMNQRLAPERNLFAPDNFRGMQNSISNKQSQITGAVVYNYRSIDKRSFRFVIDLKPGYQIEGGDLLGLAGFQPGSYTVIYDGTFHIAPLTPPAIGVNMSAASFASFQNNLVTVQLRNDGGTDLAAARLELWATPPQGQATLVTTQTVALLAQVPTAATLQWAPAQAGDWQLTARVLSPSGQLLAQYQGTASVMLPASTGAASLLASSGPRPMLPFVVLIGLAFSLITALSLRRYIPRSTASKVDDAH